MADVAAQQGQLESVLSLTPEEGNNDIKQESPLSIIQDSSVILTPEATPEKESKSLTPACVPDGNSPQPPPSSEEVKPKACKCLDVNSEPCQAKVAKPSKNESKTQSKLPRKPRGRGRSRAKPKAQCSSASPPKVSSAKASSARAKSASNQKNKTAQNNHLLTEYFPVRRSVRMTANQKKKDAQKELEEAILSKKEDGLKVVEIEGKGRGVVACKDFQRGDFVVEYAGDLIDLPTARQREMAYSADPGVGCYMYYFQCSNKSYCVDATTESGRLGRLINHSRHGNCTTKSILINDHPYLILIAKCDIREGEELLYDYGDRNSESLRCHPWLNL